MFWLRKPASPHQTALAMIGAKPGGQVLVIGAGDADLAGELARVTGLNGRTLVVDRDPGAPAKIAAASARTGGLIEHEPAPATMLPLDTGTFDVAVLNHVIAAVATSASPIVSEAARVVRDGGRVIIVDVGQRPGLFGAVQRSSAHALDSGVGVDLLKGAGLRGTRVLSEADGVLYLEGFKPKA